MLEAIDNWMKEVFTNPNYDITNDFPRQILATNPKKNYRQSFYRSKDWKELRVQALEKYGHICMACGSADQIQVDHIKPRKKFPELALNLTNLQILCWPCNKKKCFFVTTDYRQNAS